MTLYGDNHMAPQFLRVNDFVDSSIKKILGETLPSKQWEVTENFVKTKSCL
jgi:hypothetical protein